MVPYPMYNIHSISFKMKSGRVLGGRLCQDQTIDSEQPNGNDNERTC